MNAASIAIAQFAIIVAAGAVAKVIRNRRAAQPMGLPALALSWASAYDGCTPRILPERITS